MAPDGEPRSSRTAAGTRGRLSSVLVDGDLLAAHLAVGAALGFGVTVLWALTDTGAFFWPVWVWFAIGCLTSLHWLLRQTTARLMPVLDGPKDAWAYVEIVLGYKVPLLLWSSALIGVIWLLTGAGYLWPRWPWFGLLFTAGVAAVVLGVARRHRLDDRERELAERVGELTRTRQGALEVQAAELRRVERDLHDGAQSRLVALSMQLGRAEARLGDRPDEVELIRQAREEAAAAIAELRDLARGIAPPVLADRGLEAAVRSLATRAAGPVTIEARLPRRPPPVIETAAYFVVAEVLTNAAKHAPGAPLRVELELDPERLRIEVADRGPGGADPAGGGLLGLRHRVEAVDGNFSIDSPPGHGTRIQASFPLPG